MCHRFGKKMKSRKGGPNWTPKIPLSQTSPGPHKPPNLPNLVGLGEVQKSLEFTIMVPQSSTLLPSLPSPFLFSPSCPSATKLYFFPLLFFPSPLFPLLLLFLNHKSQPKAQLESMCKIKPNLTIA
jgi:hypothetical protein